MLTKKTTRQIIKRRLGDAFTADGFKWMSAFEGHFRRPRQHGSDGFAVPQVDYGDEQKISFLMMFRLDNVEEIRCEALEERVDLWRPTRGHSLGWFEGTFYVEWSCTSPEELDSASDDLLARYKPRILEFWERYADPLNILRDVDEKRGPVYFLRPVSIDDVTSALILQWLYQREGFEARLASYREHLARAGADAACVAPLERVVSWLRSHPQLTGT